MIVADTNLVSYLLIEGEHTAAARAVWAKDPGWIVPPLWRAEYLNVLSLSVRHAVLEQAQALEAWRAGLRLFGRAERAARGEAVLAVALRHRISAYDAQFVALAHAVEAPLVTSDRKLLRACRDVAVAPQAFARA